MAPEQLRGQATSQSDIYALGCTLNYLLTGRHSEPLCVSTPAEFNKTVSEELNQVIARATAQDPSERFTNAAEFADALGEPSGDLKLNVCDDASPL